MNESSTAIISKIKLLRNGRLTYPVTDGVRGDSTKHKSINAAKRHVRESKLQPGAAWTQEALKAQGLTIPASTPKSPQASSP